MFIKLNPQYGDFRFRFVIVFTGIFFKSTQRFFYTFDGIVDVANSNTLNERSIHSVVYQTNADVR